MAFLLKKALKIKISETNFVKKKGTKSGKSVKKDTGLKKDIKKGTEGVYYILVFSRCPRI